LRRPLRGRRIPRRPEAICGFLPPRVNPSSGGGANPWGGETPVLIHSGSRWLAPVRSTARLSF
jgi:hypothetical protein